MTILSANIVGMLCCGALGIWVAGGCSQSNNSYSRVFRDAEPMSPEQQLALAARSTQVYVSNPDGVSLGYLDGSTVYMMAGVRMTFEQLPSTSPCPEIIDPSRPGKLLVRNTRMPLYYVPQSSGAALVGFFEPMQGIFLQWREAVPKNEVAGRLRNPHSGATELDPHRIAKTILIPAPGAVTEVIP